jgi:DNA-directed RNA polymerase
MITQNLIIKSKDERYYILGVDDSLLDLRSKSLVDLPLKLPMIIKPKEYSKNKLGGYLLNDVNYSEDLIIKKYNIKNKSLISDENIIYNMINNISSTPYKINTELFDYILMNKHNLLINPDESSKYENIKKKSKYQQSKYNSHISKLNLQEIIIGLAEFWGGTYTLTHISKCLFMKRDQNFVLIIFCFLFTNIYL